MQIGAAKATSENSMTKLSQLTHDLASDLLWGARAIGDEIGRSPGKIYYMLEKGLIPGKKMGGTWTSSRSALRAHFATKQAAA
jgi:hypothetical protein